MRPLGIEAENESPTIIVCTRPPTPMMTVGRAVWAEMPFKTTALLEIPGGSGDLEPPVACGREGRLLVQRHGIVDAGSHP